MIYQAALREGQFIGHADFLRRVEGASALGAWRYEVLDTKLALKTKAKFLIRLACYSDLVAAAQGVLPERAHLALGDGTGVHFRVQDYAHRFTADDIRALHRLWLWPIYPGAGEFRSVNVGKGGFQFAYAHMKRIMASEAWRTG